MQTGLSIQQFTGSKESADPLPLPLRSATPQPVADDLSVIVELQDREAVAMAKRASYLADMDMLLSADLLPFPTEEEADTTLPIRADDPSIQWLPIDGVEAATVFVIDAISRVKEPINATTASHTLRVRHLSASAAGHIERMLSLPPETFDDIGELVIWHDWQKYRNEKYYRLFMAKLAGRITPKEADPYRKELFFYHCTDGGSELQKLWEARQFPPEQLERYQIATTLHHLIQEGYPTPQNIIEHGGLRLEQYDKYVGILKQLCPRMDITEKFDEQGLRIPPSPQEVNYETIVESMTDWDKVLKEAKDPEAVKLAMMVVIINACDIADGITSGRGYDPKLDGLSWYSLVRTVHDVLSMKFPPHIIHEVCNSFSNMCDFENYNGEALRRYSYYRENRVNDLIERTRRRNQLVQSPRRTIGKS